MKKYVFLRDDDVYKYDKKFLSIFKFLKSHHIPIIYAVIPGRIEKRLADFLNKEKNKSPLLFDIAQHGWRHINYSHSLGNKYEFGKNRTYKKQKEDIIKGYQKMLTTFGNNFTQAFVPPFHGYDKSTLKIIKDLGINIFSAGAKLRNLPHQLLEFPASLALNDYTKTGTPKSANIQIMLKRFLCYLDTNTKIKGIVFHHSAIKNKKELKEIKFFFLFLKKLEDAGKIKLILFSQV